MSVRVRSLARAQAIGPDARVIKSGVAVALAWWLGTLLRQPRPLFAALGALVGMEPTIIGSLRRTGVQLVGTLGEIVLAYLAVNLLGVSWLGAGLAVLLGLWLGRWLGSPDRVGVELAVGTLLIVGFASGDPHLGLIRLREVLLGGMVATAINALVFPPNCIGQVLDGLDDLTTRSPHTGPTPDRHRGVRERARARRLPRSAGRPGWRPVVRSSGLPFE